MERYRAFVNRITTEEIVIDANSEREARNRLHEQLGKREGEAESALQYILAGPRGRWSVSDVSRPSSVVDVDQSDTTQLAIGDVHVYLRKRLLDSLDLAQTLAICNTADDLANLMGMEVEDVVDTLEYFNQCKGFSTFVHRARRALDCQEVFEELLQQDDEDEVVEA